MNSRLVSIKGFGGFAARADAERAQQLLRSAGIESIICGDDAGGWAPHIGLATGGIELRVKADESENAKQILVAFDLRKEAKGNE